jgi:uncharacterized protein YkwD
MKVLLVVAALAVTLSVPATASASITLTAKEKAVLAAINKIRVNKGLAKVSVKASLIRAARAHSKEMGTNQYFAHESANGETFGTRLIRFGYAQDGFTFWKAGENIAWASNGLFSCPEVVVDNWMHSPMHKAVILTSCFRNIGIGVKACDIGFNGIGGRVWFYTLDLGRRTS